MKTACLLALAVTAVAADRSFLLGYGHKNLKRNGKPTMATRPMVFDPLAGQLFSYAYTEKLPRVHGQKHVNYNGRDYLIGGRKFSKEHLDQTLLDFDAGAHVSSELPFHVHRHAVATTLGGDFNADEGTNDIELLLLCGGIDADNDDEVTDMCWTSRANEDADGLSQWIRTGALPGPRAGHTLTRTRQGAVVIGGDGDNTVYQRDVADNDWVKKKSMPTALTNHAALLLPGKDNEILVCGGLANAVVQAACSIFNVVEDSWSRTMPLEVARHSFQLLNDDGRIIVVGGVDQNNDFVPTVEELNLDSGSMALQVEVKAANFPAVPLPQ